MKPILHIKVLDSIYDTTNNLNYFVTIFSYQNFIRSISTILIWISSKKLSINVMIPMYTWFITTLDHLYDWKEVCATVKYISELMESISKENDWQEYLFCNVYILENWHIKCLVFCLVLKRKIKECDAIFCIYAIMRT